MAEFAGSNAPFRHLLDDLSESGGKVASFGTPLGWDRKADGLPVNNRRRGIAGRAIEPLSAEYHSHDRMPKPMLTHLITLAAVAAAG
jgi:hypothetical protein